MLYKIDLAKKMSNEETPKRSPAIRCWIKHINEGVFDTKNNYLNTIFGKTKRVRLTATIIDKRDIITEEIRQNGEKNNQTHRLEYDIDDSTGLIRLIIWNENPSFTLFNKGDIIDIIGIIRSWKGFLSITPEIIREITNPNLILLRNAEIILKLKKGEICELPKPSQINEIDIDELFDESEVQETSLLTHEEIVSKIYNIILENTKRGNPTSLNSLIKDLKMDKQEIKKILRNLEFESKIYQCDNNLYESFY